MAAVESGSGGGLFTLAFPSVAMMIAADIYLFMLITVKHCLPQRIGSADECGLGHSMEALSAWRVRCALMLLWSASPPRPR
ncbi:MAG: hypothetical protein M3R61_00305 [Chloroflexota bacterium]|nr:hypothetical protein [Chloroflexota bacterium]